MYQIKTDAFLQDTVRQIGVEDYPDLEPVILPRKNSKNQQEPEQISPAQIVPVKNGRSLIRLGVGR